MPAARPQRQPPGWAPPRRSSRTASRRSAPCRATRRSAGPGRGAPWAGAPPPAGRWGGGGAAGGGFQSRVPSRRKGPAVRGPRAQADRKLYAVAMQRAVRATPGLTIVEGEADDLIIADGRAAGVRLADGRALAAGAV